MQEHVLKIEQGGAGYTVVFPAEFTELLAQSSLVRIDVVQRLCWPAACGQAAAAAEGSSQASVDQDAALQGFGALQRGETSPSGNHCFLLLALIFTKWLVGLLTYLLPHFVLS